MDSRLIGRLFFFRRLFAWLVVLLWVLGISLGGMLEFPATDPRSADVVVVLGEDPGHRYLRGKELVLDGYAKTLVLILPLPHVVENARTTLRNVDIQIISTPDSTWSEAREMRRWMEERNMRRALVITDAPHILRASYAWWSVSFGTDMDYRFIAAYPPWWSAWRWWDNKQGAFFAGMEVLKLVYYLGRYHFGIGSNE